MSVAVNKDFGRRGIAANLTQVMLECATKKGFKVCYAQCSGPYSTKALCKSGFAIENTI